MDRVLFINTLKTLSNLIEESPTNELELFVHSAELSEEEKTRIAQIQLVLAELVFYNRH